MIKKIKSKINKVRAKVHEHFKSKHRSSRWDETRDRHIEKNPICIACGHTDALQVHHVVPFQVSPSKELDYDNLITLCMGQNDCHLHIGHGGSFRYYNPDVLEDAKTFLLAPTESIRNSLIQQIRKKRTRER